MMVALLTVAHALAASVWLGAMCYSLAVLHPKARRYFPRVDEFEAFIAFVSGDARPKVLAGMAAIGLSGAALVALRDGAPRAWWILMAVKTLVLGAALALFLRVTYRMWPARVLAAPAEAAAHQAAFRRVAIAMIALAAAASAMGVLARFTS